MEYKLESQLEYESFQELEIMDKLTRLHMLTTQLEASFKEVAEYEARLEEAKANRQMLQEDVIPTAMHEAGQDLLKMPDGKYLCLESELKVRVPKNAAEEAYAYLEDIGEGGMIKRTVVCEFRQDQTEEAQAALEALRKAGFHQAEIQKTHAWQTLQAWVKSKFEDGEDVPRELFGVHEREVAKVKVKV